MKWATHKDIQDLYRAYKKFGKSSRKAKKRRKKKKLLKKNKPRLSYKEYLKSDKWRRKRIRVFIRANGICEICKVNKAEQVHHKTYKNIYKEPLTDLVAVCETCHRDAHNLLDEEEIENAVNKLIQKEGYK